jgi:hypothetical protein
MAPAHIFRWDLDKTYLRTDFDSLRGLVRSAFEPADKKRAVPGASALLRELHAAGAHRICFISGSPRQMRKVLEQKLHLDGVQFDEFILKPNMSNLLRGRFRAIREQVGYKLPALLAGRVGVAPDVPETLFGDDAESDALIYSLYADLLRRAVTGEVLQAVLERAGVYPDVAERTLALAERIQEGISPVTGVVRRIFIHLDRRSPPARFDRYGRRLVPIYNYFQAAVALYQERVLDAAAVVRVGADMLERSGYDLDALGNTYQDLVRRGRIGAETSARLAAEVERSAAVIRIGEGTLDAPEVVESFAGRIRALGDRASGVAAAAAEADDCEPADVDYVRAIEEDLPLRGRSSKSKQPPRQR